MTREEAIQALKKEKRTALHENKVAFDMAIKALEQEPKVGHWIKISPANIYECSECGQNVMTQDICAYKFCHGCGAKMVEPQENEVEDGNDD